MNQMNKEYIIRVTKSICPVCLEHLEAFVLVNNGQVFLSKECPKHGKFKICLSKTAQLYEDLEKFYFAVMGIEQKQADCEIWTTYRCNMDCPICILGTKESKERQMIELTVAHIEQFIKTNKYSLYTLSGAEATCNKNTIEIIKILKKHRKNVVLNTNGIKLADGGYVRLLKTAGLDRVAVQFDGFKRQAGEKFRGVDVLDTKLKALENLKNMQIKTTLIATIAKHINEDDVSKLIDFALKNDFISGVGFTSISFGGGARDWNLNNYLMPDEIIDLVEKKTGGKIAKRNVYLFQKFIFAFKSFFSQRCCLYNQAYLLVRNGDKFSSISEFLNFELANFWLNKYQKLYGKSKIASAGCLAMASICLILKKKSILVINNLILSGFSYLLKTAHYLSESRFVFLSFSTTCDPYKIDYSIVRNCQLEIMRGDRMSGKIENAGREGLYCIELEKQHLKEKKEDLVA